MEEEQQCRIVERLYNRRGKAKDRTGREERMGESTGSPVAGNGDRATREESASGWLAGPRLSPITAAPGHIDFPHTPMRCGTMHVTSQSRTNSVLSPP